MELRFRSQKLLLLLILMAFALSACGGGSSENVSSESDTNVEEILEDEVETTEETVAEEETDTTEDTIVEEENDTTEDTIVEEETDISEDTVVEQETETTEDTVVEEETDATEDTVVEEETDATEETIVEEEFDATEETETNEEIIVEELLVDNGVLKLNPKFTQEEINSGDEVVTLQVGHTFQALTPVNGNNKLSIESSLKISTLATEDTRSIVFNSITISDNHDVFEMGFGLRSNGNQSEQLDATHFLNRKSLEGKITKFYEPVYSDSVGNNFSQLNLVRGQSYTLKLEYDLLEEKVNGYIDGLHAVSWEFPDKDRQEDSVRGPVTVKAYVESLYGDSLNHSSITEGSSFISEVDHLKTSFDGSTLFQDDFEGGLLNEVSYVERSTRKYTLFTQSFYTGFLTRNPWYVIRGFDSFHYYCTDKLVFNENNHNGLVTRYNGDNVFSTFDFDYYPFNSEKSEIVIDLDSFHDETVLESWRLNELTSTNFKVTEFHEYAPLGIAQISLFMNREDALTYAESIGLNNCATSLPL